MEMQQTQKTVMYQEITCNVAFLDVCKRNSTIYLFCCTGLQYPSYPCFGCPSTGYAQHSSICRAALVNGVKCGRQFVVYYSGESCTFGACQSNGVVTQTYQEWTKSYKIRDVNSLMHEHSDMKSRLDASHEHNRESTEKITELHKELECANNTQIGQHREILDLREEKSTLKDRIISLETENKEITDELQPGSTISSEQFDYLKAENVQLKLDMDDYLKERDKFQTVYNDLVIELTQLRDGREKQNVQKNKENESQLIERELCGGHIEILKQHQMSIRNVAERFQKSKLDLANSDYEPEQLMHLDNDDDEEVDSNGSHRSGSAMSDMREVLSPLKKLNIQFQEDIPVSSNSVGQLQNALKRLKTITANEKVWSGRNGPFENICSSMDTLSSLFKSDSENKSFLSSEDKSAAEVVNSYVLSPANISINTKLEDVIRENETEYAQQKEKFRGMQNEIRILRQKRLVSDALKKTKFMQQMIVEELLPKNCEIRTILHQNSFKETVKNLKNFKSHDRFEKQQTILAEDDLHKLETISPIDTNIEKKLHSLASKLEVACKRDENAASTSLKTLQNLLMEHISIVTEMGKHKIEQIEVHRDINAIDLKKLRWNEAKNSRTDQLHEFIERQKSLIEFGRVLNQFVEVGVSSIRQVLNNHIENFDQKDKSLKQEYVDLFDDLYISVFMDRENKQAQLKKVEDMKNILEGQLDEATELMDEDQASQIESQLEGLPGRQKTIKGRLEQVEIQLAELDSNEEVTVICKDLGRVPARVKAKERAAKARTKTTLKAIDRQRDNKSSSSKHVKKALVKKHILDENSSDEPDEDKCSQQNGKPKEIFQKKAENSPEKISTYSSGTQNSYSSHLFDDKITNGSQKRTKIGKNSTETKENSEVPKRKLAPKKVKHRKPPKQKSYFSRLLGGADSEGSDADDD